MAVTSALTQKWWEWFYSTPLEREDQHQLYPNPDSDEARFLVSNVDGRDTNLFLNATATQSRPILFPAAKWISIGLPFCKDSELIKAAKERIDTLERFNITIDDKPITPVRVATMPFNLNLKRDIIPPPTAYQKVKKIRKGRYRAVGDAYWVLLNPPKEGNYKIHTHVRCAQNIVRIDVHHNLEIV